MMYLKGDSLKQLHLKFMAIQIILGNVCILNNVVNRYYDWALDEFNFQQFVKDKYDNPRGNTSL